MCEENMERKRAGRRGKSVRRSQKLCRKPRTSGLVGALGGWKLRLTHPRAWPPAAADTMQGRRSRRRPWGLGSAGPGKPTVLFLFSSRDTCRSARSPSLPEPSAMITASAPVRYLTRGYEPPLRPAKTLSRPRAGGKKPSRLLRRHNPKPATAGLPS